jgi:outer membrane biosynthesis protein TonB
VAYTICVAPDGRIVRQTPRIRAGAALDRAATDALRNWLFMALPPAAPQVEQCGVITFRFTLG